MTREKIVSGLVTALAAVWGLLTPIHGLMLAIGVLVAADFVTGVSKAFKLKNKITSRKFRHTIGKSLVYITAIIAGFALDYLASNDTPLIAKALAVAIGLTEAKSIAENFEAITGIDILKVILEKFKPKPSDNDTPAKDE